MNGPEPEDSEQMEMMSMKSSQTYNVLRINKQKTQEPRRTNSQENRIS
jgi:hypothetical protein